MPGDHEKLPNQGSKYDKEFPNIGFPGIFVVVFVSSYFAAQIVCDITVLLLYGWHSFFVEGLRVADWKHAILSNGAPMPWWGAEMIGLPALPVWALIIFGTEVVAGHVRKFLALRSRWVMIGMRLLGSVALIGFSLWLFLAPQSFPLIHPVPLSAFIGGVVLLWKASVAPFRRPAA